MTAALSQKDETGQMDYLALLDKQDWTVDDVTKLPEDLRYGSICRR